MFETSPSITIRWNDAAALGLALERMWRTYQRANSGSSATEGEYSRSIAWKNSASPQRALTSRSHARHCSSVRAHG